MFGKPKDLPTADTALPGRQEPLATDTVHFVSGRPLKGPYPEGFQVSYFGMGCFWGVERVFWQEPGVWVTAVGQRPWPIAQQTPNRRQPSALTTNVCSGNVPQRDVTKRVNR